MSKRNIKFEIEFDEDMPSQEINDCIDYISSKGGEVTEIDSD